ncbi:ATP-dependent RNA helicase dbp4 [Umbelopsis nana]
MAKSKKENKVYPVNKRKQKRLNEDQELQEIESKAADPQSHSNCKLFSELPISSKTLEGLKRANYVELTDIQRKAVPLGLAKRDVLGAAKTGSGKTLAFLIPILEVLYRAKWNHEDGLGALVISPTRELAVQIFEVLKKIGKQHMLSAGLIIGGKDLAVEQERVAKMNILVATPGRLLQHMDQTAGFDCDNLQVLVLDEADRILDMGFQKELNAIVDNLPKQRQTLLFSATQTKSVKDLARLSLKDPEYVAVHEKADHSTPQKLSQHYLVCELPKKLDILYSFIRTHLQSKIVVFISSCNQTRFVFETFCKLHPGIPLLHLHGKQKQTKRVEIFRKYCAMRNAVLFATDIAARGLDFPAVDWVIQLDCPEDADTYIHRVGRTARFDAAGQALLFLLPSEKDAMQAELAKKKVPIEEVKIRASKQQSIQNQLQSFCFQDPEIKHLGQKAFIAYMRSVYLQKNKDIFKVHNLPAEEYAQSIGLPGAPKIKFVKASAKASAAKEAQRAEIMAKAAAKTDEEEEEESSSEEESDAEENMPQTKTAKPTSKIEKMFLRKNQNILSEHYNKLVDFEEEDNLLNSKERGHEDDDFITIKRRDHKLESDEEAEPMLPMSRRQLKLSKAALAKKQSKGERIVFDDEGKPHALYEMQDEESFLKDGDAATQREKFLAEETNIMKEADVEDKLVAKEKRREKRLAKKLREREQEQGGGDAGAVLGGSSDEFDEEMEEVQSEEETAGRKREPKWFEDDSEEEEEESRKKAKLIEIEQPETIADQEALALKLLGAA